MRGSLRKLQGGLNTGELGLLFLLLRLEDLQLSQDSLPVATRFDQLAFRQLRIGLSCGYQGVALLKLALGELQLSRSGVDSGRAYHPVPIAHWRSGFRVQPAAAR